MWLKTGKRSLERVPIIASARTYGTEWVKWWTTAQPQERDTQQWPFSRDPLEDVCWRQFPANGKDGIFLAVMALSWWASTVRSSDEVGFFEEAVANLHWVIQELIRVKTASQISLSPPPSSQDKSKPHQRLTPRRRNPVSHPPASSSHSQALPSGPPVSTLSIYRRAEGKQVVKPTWKELEYNI